MNPLHTGGRENEQIKFGGQYGSTSPALDLIRKSIQMLSWGYSDSEAGDNYIFKNDSAIFGQRNLTWLAGTGIDTQNIKLWGDALAFDAKSWRSAAGIIYTNDDTFGNPYNTLEVAGDFGWNHLHVTNYSVLKTGAHHAVHVGPKENN
eukprot:SAG22_NODE_1725_length_3714_cov_3.037621_1_plen_148_part_00